MTTVAVAPLQFQTVGKLIEHLGIPPERIRLSPAPGTATIQDAVASQGIPCELVDGVLVEKPMGYYESILASLLMASIGRYLEDNGDPGFLLGEAGMVWVKENQMRMADVAYISWDHFPNRELMKASVLDQTPDWAIEILSPTNTRKEMDRKRREYFEGGAQLVWQVYPDTKTVEAYTAPNTFTTHREGETISGAPVLPGFSLSIKRWFDRAGQGLKS